MNLFLANKRAENYDTKLIDAIQSETGKTLKITRLDGIVNTAEHLRLN